MVYNLKVEEMKKGPTETTNLCVGLSSSISINIIIVNTYKIKITYYSSQLTIINNLFILLTVKIIMCKMLSMDVKH